MTISGRQNLVSDRANVIRIEQNPNAGDYSSGIDPLRADYDAVWTNRRGTAQGLRKLRWAGEYDERSKLVSQGGNRKVDVLFSRYTSMMDPDSLTSYLADESFFGISSFTERVRYSRIGDESWADELGVHGGGSAATARWWNGNYFSIGPGSEFPSTSEQDYYGRYEEEILVLGDPEAFASMGAWVTYLSNQYAPGALAAAPFTFIGEGTFIGAGPYFDHAHSYQSLWSLKDDYLVNNGLSWGIGEVKFDYNFYTQPYEDTIGSGFPGSYFLLENALPHIYTFYLENQRKDYTLANDPPEGYEEVIPAPLDAPSLPLGMGPPGENLGAPWRTYDYESFITLNYNLPNVWTSRVLGSSGTPGERTRSGYFRRDETAYYSAWSRYLSENVATSTIRGLARKYANIIIPATTVGLMQNLNTYKEIFPMFAEIRFAQFNQDAIEGTSPGDFIANKLSEDNSTGRMINNLMRDKMISDALPGMIERDASAFEFTPGNPDPYAAEGRWVIESQVEDRRQVSTIVQDQVSAKTFDLANWMLNDNAVGAFAQTIWGLGVVNNSDFNGMLFLRNFAEESFTDDLINPLSLDAPGPEFSVAKDHVVNSMRGYLRTYERLLQGEKAFSENLYYKIEKFSITPGGGNTLLQKQYLPDTSAARNVVKIIDTQMRYNRRYRYKISVGRAIVGSQTNFTRLEVLTAPGAGGAGLRQPPEWQVHLGSGTSMGVNGRWFVAYDVDADSAAIGDLTEASRSGRSAAEMRLDLGADASTSNQFISTTMADFPPETSQTPYIARVKVVTRPSIKLVELPYSGLRENFIGQGAMVDDPPMPPEVDFIPYKGVGNKILINLNTGIGSEEFEPVSFSEEETQLINNIRSTYIDPNKTAILYENDDPSVDFEIYRLSTKPESYEEFINNLLTISSTSTEETNFKKTSSTSFVDNINTNQKYYYIVRARDIHGHVSPPTAVYEVELIESENSPSPIYPRIRTIQFASDEDKRTTQNKMRRFLQVKPQLSQVIFNQTALEAMGEGEPDTAPTMRDVLLGVDEELIWGKQFKIRLTSRKTGRKIDLNINFKKSLSDQRGDEELLEEPVVYVPPPPTPPSTGTGGGGYPMTGDGRKREDIAAASTPRAGGQTRSARQTQSREEMQEQFNRQQEEYAQNRRRQQAANQQRLDQQAEYSERRGREKNDDTPAAAAPQGASGRQQQQEEYNRQRGQQGPGPGAQSGQAPRGGRRGGGGRGSTSGGGRGGGGRY